MSEHPLGLPHPFSAEEERACGLNPESGGPGKPWVFARILLTKVSRTFALNIGVLPQPLRRQILLAYLFCRMADTVEDDPTLAPEEKETLLGHFAALFAEGAEAPEASAFLRNLPAAWRDSSDPNHYLCRMCPPLVALFRQFHPAVRAPIAGTVQEMCSGMASFGLRHRVRADGWMVLDTLADLDSYCYYVAGTVGNMLCDLFHLHTRSIGDETYRRMRTLAVSFGLGLQITNIVKDISEDASRKVCFAPAELFAKVGAGDPAEALGPEISPRSAAVVRELAEKAWSHLSDAMDYTLLIPALEMRMRLFCLWPLLMAAETLLATGDGTPVLDPNHKVKISRDDVKRILRDTSLRFWRGGWLRGRFARLHARHRELLRGTAHSTR